MKAKYNELIKQIDQAEKWLIANNKRQDIQKYIDKFQNKLNETNKLIAEIEKELGRKMTSQEILEGF